MSRYTVASLVLIFIFLLTAKTFTYEQSLTEGYLDLTSYRFIVDNGFDRVGGANLASHHLERWPLHMLVRILSQATDLDFWVIYQVLTLALLVLSFFVIASLVVPDPNKIAAFALILFNPYGFRLFYSIPGMISDTVLYVGFLVVVCGLLNKSQKQIFLGIILAAIGRQTSVLLVPFFVALWWFKEIKLKDLLIYSLALFGCFFFFKLTTLMLFNPKVTSVVKAFLGLILWFVNDFSIERFVAFFGRYLVFILTLSPLLFLTKKTSKTFWLFLAGFFLIQIQPLAFGPNLCGENVARLCSLGLPFLIAPIVMQKLEQKSLNYFLLLLVLLSLHHKFSFVYYLSGRKLLFGLIVFSSLLFVLCLKFFLSAKKIYKNRGFVV